MARSFPAINFRPPSSHCLILFLTMTRLFWSSCGSSHTPPASNPGTPAPTSVTDVVTYHNDVARTGQNLQETTLTTSNVNSSSFGKLFTATVDGVIDAEPLYLSRVSLPSQGTHNVLYVVTENDSVYAFDADSGTQLWKVSLLKSGETPSGDFGCGQISPQIGITSTPVIDRHSGPNGTIYVVAMSQTSSTYFQRIHALDITTGQEQFGGPFAVQASYPGQGDNSQNGSVIFDPKQYAERQGLLLLNQVVYTAWTSHCDSRPYTGWLIGYNENTLAQTSVLNLTPNGEEGSIWQSGAGMASDGSNLYFLDANGTFDTTLNGNGFPQNGDFGQAFLKVSTNSNHLAVADYFEMSNGPTESADDTDFGSGGALLLPAMQDSGGTTRNLAVGAGKDSNIYIVDRSNMGKFHASGNQIYQEIDGALSGGMWAMPAFFGNSLYFGSVGNNLLQFNFSQAKLSTSPASKSSNSFQYPGTTPSISANTSTNAIVWAIEHSDPNDVLHAYDATNLAQELYNSSQASGQRDQFGQASHFGTPMIVNGKVYVGTTTNVTAFGLLAK
ncbi:MAG TPA: PQQ-binding-like beta-propeller repeat protein [Terriglobales bacterium]|nr:PQQ-binding-like beta-propeller repeat protein [Terriglobales bacterium]